MKIGVKLIIFCVASVTLIVSSGGLFLLLPDLLSGVQGPFIVFFLGYCGIIVVAQVFAFIEILRSQHKNTSEESQRYGAKIESV